MDEKKKEVPEVETQKQLKKDLTSAFKTIADVLEYKNISNDIINKRFKKTEKLGEGEVSLTIKIDNLLSKETFNALDKLQDFSNTLTLIFEEIPNSILKS